jgi:phage gp36-like protein
MAQTPDSTSTPYASASDLLLYRDYRSIAQWILDDDTVANEATVLASPKVSTALMAASGEIESACAAGGRYVPADLNALTGASLQMLKELCCSLAFWRLAIRRLINIQKEDISGVADAYDLLEQLRLGQRIFSTTEAQDAGLGESIDMNRVVPGQQRLLTSRMYRFFPRSS